MIECVPSGYRNRYTRREQRSGYPGDLCASFHFVGTADKVAYHTKSKRKVVNVKMETTLPRIWPDAVEKSCRMRLIQHHRQQDYSVDQRKCHLVVGNQVWMCCHGIEGLVGGV